MNNVAFRWTVWLCAVILAVTACQQSYLATLAIESDPTGARIEVDKEYVGVAPLTVDVPISVYNDRIDGSIIVDIRALPSFPGLYSQTKLLDKYDLVRKLRQGKKVTRLLFDMRLQPVPKTYRFEYGR